MKDQNAIFLNAELHRNVAVPKGVGYVNGTAVEIDIQTQDIDEVHVFCPLAFRFTWAKIIGDADVNIVDVDKSCSTMSGGELTFHVRKMREDGYQLWIVSDDAFVTTLSYWCGRYYA